MSNYSQGKLARDITVGIASNQKASDAFKEVVLRVWRASNSPDAQPDKLCPVESIETMYMRELRIRDMVGLPRPGGVNSSQTLNLSSTQTQGESQSQTQTQTALGMRSSVNVSSSTSLTGMFGRTSTRNLAIENNENVLSGTASIPNGNTVLSKNNSSSRLDQIPLGEQLHTPFNARELLWNGQSILWDLFSEITFLMVWASHDEGMSPKYS